MVAKKPVKKAAKKAVKKVAKAAPAKKAAPKVKPMAVVKDKPLTKSEVHALVADHACITKKQAGAALDALTMVIQSHLKKGAVGNFKLNGLCNIKTVKKPARKAREGVNPFTGEKIMIKAKPAHKAVKVVALKQLKGMIEQ